ncbi:uncharacterized protein LOC125525086 isoform X2 [Triticum urartu]|uniref:uncharacterized protein LOC125525086 isoform X2 n=1 Tax=Triticum urartu TaxID=4572 RepID=UPI002042E4E6|nr:uncharacterized protein LOC125525086 isoform X2 [Triticum urartu]
MVTRFSSTSRVREASRDAIRKWRQWLWNQDAGRPQTDYLVEGVGDLEMGEELLHPSVRDNLWLWLRRGAPTDARDKPTSHPKKSKPIELNTQLPAQLSPTGYLSPSSESEDPTDAKGEPSSRLENSKPVAELNKKIPAQRTPTGYLRPSSKSEDPTDASGEPGSRSENSEEFKKEPFLNRAKFKKELAAQKSQNDSGEIKTGGLLPIVNFHDRQVQVEEWKKEAEQFETDFAEMVMKIHRFPPSLRGLSRRYIVPMVVSIGLYHHGSSNLHDMEKVKRVATHHFIKDSGHSFEEMHSTIFSIIGVARSFYDTKHAKVDVGDAEFAAIMFIDGCFLLQYMFICTDPGKLPPSLLSCFESNQACISNDIMLLENQLPWLVVETLRRFKHVPVEDFIGKMGRTLQIRGDIDRRPVVLNRMYKTPHLLGTLMFHIVGITNDSAPLSDPNGSRSMSKSISAIELAEIGIELTPGKTTKFMDMGMKKGFLSGEIFLAPLLLDDVRSCWLVNMVAYEVCAGMATCAGNETNTSKTVVCSYLSFLAMLMDREEDVHELRSKRLVQGELTNKETLDFFKMLVKHISGGALYVHIMEEVESYKLNRWMWIKVHQFIYKNFKTIVTVLSIIGVLVGIFKTLLSLKEH